MKVVLTKISIVVILMSCVLAFTLTGCGNAGTGNTGTSEDEYSASSQDDSNQDGVNSSVIESADSNDSSAEEYSELIFGDLDNLGNNPNNLNQCPGGIAFDDEYIYYADNSAGNVEYTSISRIHYDGTGYEILPIEDVLGNEDLLLNIKDGYLYYVASDNSIKRYNIETNGIEAVMQSDANPAEITNMLIVNDYLYVAIDLNKNTRANMAEKSARVDVCDLNTFDTLTVCEKDGLASVPVVTSDGENVYLAYSTGKNKLYSIDVAKVKAYFENEATEEEYGENVALEITGSNYLNKSIILAKNGFMEVTNNDSVSYAQSDYTGISYSGESFGLISSFADNEEYINQFSGMAMGGKFIAENSLILIVSNSNDQDEIVIFRDMDLNNPEIIYTFDAYWDYCMFGIHDDMLYMIEFESKNGPVNLISIDAQGQIFTTSIS
ncbi:MAG: DUF5050 domain-containing protein [Ruminococcus sp.]|nr:DUF5050 domain-containing protein [Eubacterium sp.]MCC8110070.1 DUF5050 domain-containing protein [Ruminococcus sp.]